MPETKSKALARAKKLGFKKSDVVKGSAGYFIAPHGLKTQKAKNSYAGLRSSGKSKETSAKIAHYIDKKKGKK